MLLVGTFVYLEDYNKNCGSKKSSGVLFPELYFLYQIVSFFSDAGSTFVYSEQNRHHASIEVKNVWSFTSTLSVPLWLA